MTGKQDNTEKKPVEEVGNSAVEESVVKRSKPKIKFDAGRADLKVLKGSSSQSPLPKTVPGGLFSSPFDVPSSTQEEPIAQEDSVTEEDENIGEPQELDLIQEDPVEVFDGDDGDENHAESKTAESDPQDTSLRFDLLLDDDVEELNEEVFEVEQEEEAEIDFWADAYDPEEDPKGLIPQDVEIGGFGIVEDQENSVSEEQELSEVMASGKVGAEKLKTISEYHAERLGLMNIGTPEEITLALAEVGYHCPPFLASQLALCLNTKTEKVRSMMLEGPPGCGKSYLAKCFADIVGAEFMCLSCYEGMDLQHLIESPSSLALVNAMAGRGADEEKLMNLGILSRAFVASQEKPVILLIDELDKVGSAIDTFFLGPLQDAKIYLESRAPIEANVNNLLIFFTKNFERSLNDALMRRVHPVSLNFLDATIERKILSDHCLPRLIENLSSIADTMRYSDDSYKFERPPAPEELLTTGRYLMQLLEWDVVDFTFVGRNVWFMLAKSDNDRYVLELLLRYHPAYYDSLEPNGRKLTKDQVYAKLGRLVLEGIIEDPEAQKRKDGYKAEAIGLTNIGGPKDLIRKLRDVHYECLPYLAVQTALILNTQFERVRAILLEGPPGCGKSYLAKCLAKISGAEFMCLSCYANMNFQHLIEQPSTLGMANALAGGKEEDLVNLGILSKAFLKSRSQPVILLIDEIDKVEVAIDTFFLGPIQDGTIYLESRPPIDANLDNLLLVFTKNYERNLNDALLRRMHPIRMTFLNSEMEEKILAPYCNPKLIRNIISIVDRMRHSGGTYGFDRPPAPEEILILGRYVNNLLDWGITDFIEVGRNVWASVCKSEHDRAVLDHMLRFHPDFLDPLMMDGKGMTMDDVYAKLGRTILRGIVEDPDKVNRAQAWDNLDYDY